MFTGIIEGLGIITTKTSDTLSVAAALDDINIGDSIAVNGICLTVTRIAEEKKINIINFDYSPETAKRTNLFKLDVGCHVNIERALKLGSRFGGHIISGHVDCCEKLLKIQHEQNFYILTFSLNPEDRKYIVQKGSISIDGISLTIANCGKDMFSAVVIPHTLEMTNLKFKKAGDLVNIEFDIFSKYIENIILNRNSSNKITSAFLKENGF